MWQSLWTWVFGLSVVLFFLVEVVVVFGGARDIGSMLRALRQQAREEGEGFRPDQPGPAGRNR